MSRKKPTEEEIKKALLWIDDHENEVIAIVSDTMQNYSIALLVDGLIS